MNKKSVFALLSVAVLFILGWFLYSSLLTRIVFINFGEAILAEVQKANTSFWIRISALPKEDDFSSVTNADMIFTFHVALLNDEQSKNLEKAKKNGAKVYMHSSTSREFASEGLNEDQEKQIAGYLTNSSNENLTNLLRYIRLDVSGNSFFSESFDAPKTYPKDVFYRIGATEFYEDIAQYWEFYKSKNLYHSENKTVAIINAYTSPQFEYRSYQDSLILKLERNNLNVVVLGGFVKRLEQLKAVNPDLVIYFAHGRLSSVNSEAVTDWLKEKNIPVLNPQIIFQPLEDWEKDQQGLSGALLGQNLVVPEIDGAIYPYAVAAQTKTETSYHTFTEIPGKMDRFVEVVQNWLRLKDIPNAEKKISIYYYKGAGQNALVAENLEVGSSLLNTLNYLKEQGFNTGTHHPKTEKELLERIQKEGPVYGEYAKGSFDRFIKEGNPELIPVEEYLQWVKSELNPESYREVEALYGKAPGSFSSTTIDGKSYVVVPRLQFGNVTLLPVLPSALGESEYKMVHGVKKAPPHAYIASYLWSRMKNHSDVIIHWGTHGNLEFTPWKQVGLSDKDWAEVLIAPLPHLYVYSTNNIGEAMIAKRRSQATMISHLTSPLDESGLYGNLKVLDDAITNLQETAHPQLAEQYKKNIRILLDTTHVARDLELSNTEVSELDADVIARISHYLFHLNSQRIQLGMHTFGESFNADETFKTVRMMSLDALVNSLQEYEFFVNPKAKEENEKLNLEKHRREALKMIEAIYKGANPHRYMKKSDLEEILNPTKFKALSEEKRLVLTQLKENLESIPLFKSNLQKSARAELESLQNGLMGGYIAPSPGGDPAVNPWTVPTGRNMYSINAENTPTKEAWNVGKQMGDLLLQKHISKHGKYPQKLAFTLWSSEFIRDNGMNIAQILYMIGAEPVWNYAGRVHDVRLIPIEKLGRPRIDVIVQTSGQLRDIAASRLSLINKAVALAAAEETDADQNFVRAGSLKAEGIMKEKGLSPNEARQFANKRVFGGVNGAYGTAIMGLVEKGDRWESEEEIAKQYIQNMGALYDDEAWSVYKEGIFEAMMSDAEAIVHPRSSSVTGPINLDHVYEFMGGLTLSIRNVTGKDPDGYFNDYRNKFNPFVQDLKEAIWAETRSNLFNPKFIQAQMKEGASAAEYFAENFRDTYGWNVMKPDAIDKEIWEGYYENYVKDSHNLGTVAFFKEKNPFAFEEMTAVMLETIRKGYWKPSEEVKKEIANLHVDLVKDFTAGCSGFVCDNAKLQAMIEETVGAEAAKEYVAAIQNVQQVSTDGDQKQGMILQKEEITLERIKQLVQDNKSAVYTLIGTILLISIAFAWGVIRKRRRA